MNLRTRYKRLKQYIDFVKCTPDEVFIDRTQLTHLRLKMNVPVFYGPDNEQITDFNAMAAAVEHVTNEFADGIQEYIERLPDGTVQLDIWVRPLDALVKDGIRVIGDQSEIN